MGFVRARLEIFRPKIQRVRIVTAQAFDVNRFEPAALHRFEPEADVGNSPSGNT
ncbi:hypothetical protein OKW30_005597 [Paraburkholderia sp. Clong3]